MIKYDFFELVLLIYQSLSVKSNRLCFVNFCSFVFSKIWWKKNWKTILIDLEIERNIEAIEVKKQMYIDFQYCMKRWINIWRTHSQTDRGGVRRGHRGLVLVKPLTTIINKSIKTGIFPNQWKEAIVVPILKRGKDRS